MGDRPDQSTQRASGGLPITPISFGIRLIHPHPLKQAGNTFWESVFAPSRASQEEEVTVPQAKKKEQVAEGRAEC